MKSKSFYRFSVTFLFGLSLFSVPSHAESTDSCLAPGRNTQTCFEMKQIRSALNLIDAQRDLMQLNYPYLEAVSQDLNFVLSSIIIRSESNPHMGPLSAVRNQVSLLGSQAAAQDIRAVQTGNEIRSKCLACHAAEVAPAGRSWDEISKGSWDTQSKICLEEGHNPYVCRSMLAMLAPLTYINAAERNNYQSYVMTEKVADEVGRIAKDMSQKKVLHSADLPFEQIALEAAVVATMAKNQNPAVFGYASNLRNSCMYCHGEQ